jgi:N-acetyl-anhydromuramyl-L-alanine amidase AmpD
MIPNESGVTVIPNNNFYAGRNGLKPRYVILHGTAGGTSAVALANYFASTEGTANASSAHYIIGRAGEIVQAVSESDGAWANGYISDGHDSWWNPNINPNNITISIEHCKPSTDNSDGLTTQQQAASFRLIQHICQRWNIPMRTADANGGITGHFSMDPVNRSRCPGPYPWDQLWTYLQQGDEDMLQITDTFAATYFTDAGNGRWNCKVNNLHVMGDILNYYRRIQGAPRLPLTNENRNIPNVAWQAFEAGIIVYDPRKLLDHPAIPGNCYLVKFSDKIAQDFLLRKQLVAVSAQTNSDGQSPFQQSTLPMM